MGESNPPLRILLHNQNWFVAELKALGHEVVCAGWAHEGFDLRFERLIDIDILLQRLPNGFQPNRVVYFDDSHSVSVRGLERLKIPSLFYSIDIHHHWRSHAWFSSLFDVIAVAQRDFAQRISQTNPDVPDSVVHWLPLWAPVYVNPNPEKTIDVCFRGTLQASLHPERALFFEKLGALVPVDAAEGPYTSAYPLAKIVLNQSVGREVNFRVFEAMMCGAAVVTPRVENGLLELFQDGVHLRTYELGNAEDAARVIRELLSDEASRRAIAEAGREEVLLRHSASLRAAWLVSALQAEIVRPKSRKWFGAAMTYVYALGTYRTSPDMDSDLAAVYRAALLESAATAILESLHCNEGVDEEFRAAVLIFKCYFEAVVSKEVLLEFSARMRNSRPDEFVFTMSYIEDLLALERYDEAEAAAQVLPGATKDLIESIPRLMADAKMRVLEAVRR